MSWTCIRNPTIGLSRMDEQPVQLVKETRAPMAATKNRPRRVDYEYSEPLAGWRQATTKAEWAVEVADPVGRTLRRL